MEHRVPVMLFLQGLMPHGMDAEEHGIKAERQGAQMQGGERQTWLDPSKLPLSFSPWDSSVEPHPLTCSIAFWEQAARELLD